MPRFKPVLFSFLAFLSVVGAPKLVADDSGQLKGDVWGKAGYKCTWYKSWDGPVSGVALFKAPSCSDGKEAYARRCVGIAQCAKGDRVYYTIATCLVKGDAKCSDRSPHECAINGDENDHLLLHDRETKYFEDLAKATEERRDVSQSKPHVKR